MSLISNGIKRRAVYRFKCSGVCGKRKVTFVYERARDRACLSCSKLMRTVVDQPGLFSEGIAESEGTKLSMRLRNTALNDKLNEIREGNHGN